MSPDTPTAGGDRPPAVVEMDLPTRGADGPQTPAVRETDLPHQSRSDARTQAEAPDHAETVTDQPTANVSSAEHTAALLDESRQTHYDALQAANEPDPDTPTASELREGGQPTASLPSGAEVSDADGQTRGSHYQVLAQVEAADVNDFPDHDLNGEADPPPPGPAGADVPDESDSPPDGSDEQPDSETPEPADSHPPKDALSPAEKDEFLAYEHQLVADGKTRPVTGHAPDAQYQRRVCGDVEFRLTPDELLPKAAWADGLNRDEALAQDSKHVTSEGSSFYKPETLPPFLAAQAQADIDIRLSKYNNAIKDTANPVRGLEIITNDPSAAEFFASRMAALDVPGKVTLRD